MKKTKIVLTKIDDIITKAFKVKTPAQIAATELFMRGVTEETLNNHKKNTLLEDKIFIPVQNELRDLWREYREGIRHI